MPREIVTPMLARKKPDVANVQKQIDEARAAQAARRDRVTELLVEAFEPLSERDRQIVRREVALSATDKPMTADELLLWMDERCIGVARYMVAGRIV